MIIYYYVLMCLIFGTTFLAIKLGINAGFAPFMFAGLRFGTAAILILAFLGIKKIQFPRSLTVYVELAYVGICMTGITFAALYWAEQYISSGLAALLSATGPLMLLIMGMLVDRKKCSFMQLIGAFVGIIGVYLIVLPKMEGGMTNSWLQGAIAIVTAEFFYAIGAIHSRRILSGSMTPLMMNGFQMLFGSFGLIMASFCLESQPFGMVDLTQAIVSLLYLIFIGSIVAQGIYYWLVKATNPLFPSTWLYVSPVIALFVGYLILGETAHPISIIGAFAVLGGVYLTNYQQLKGMIPNRIKQENVNGMS
jgi:drug/metabolite transporter (DMT)-like permease